MIADILVDLLFGASVTVSDSEIKGKVEEYPLVFAQ